MVGPRVTGCFSTLSLENQQGSRLRGDFPNCLRARLSYKNP